MTDNGKDKNKNAAAMLAELAGLLSTSEHDQAERLAKQQEIKDQLDKLNQGHGGPRK